MTVKGGVFVRANIPDGRGSAVGGRGGGDGGRCEFESDIAASDGDCFFDAADHLVHARCEEGKCRCGGHVGEEREESRGEEWKVETEMKEGVL